MSASFYELLKYAKTGIASPSMTGYDKLKALAMCKGGFPVATLTGIPPLSFRSDGTPLTAWSISGNMTQTGTPTPTVPIQPEECGDRTGNLFDVSTVEKGRIDNGVVGYAWNTTALSVDSNSATYSTDANFRGICSDFIEIPNDTTQISFEGVFSGGGGIAKKFVFYDSQKVWLNSDVTILPQYRAGTATVPSTAKFVRLSFVSQTTGESSISNFMLNLGSTALPYEPYGYKIPISLAGQTVPIYLGQTQTVRKIRKLVLTGEEYWQIWNANFFSSVIDRLVLINDIVCTHFINSKYNGISYDKASSSGLKIASVAVPDITSAAELKQWLATQYAAGTPVTVWYVLAEPETGIVNEPLAKIGDYADELNSTDAAVTIPTIKGENTLTVDTDLQPSEVSITGRIKS